MTRRGAPASSCFVCPACGKPMQVVDVFERHGTIRRRRACPDGHAAITTKETKVAA